jgi:hypothetical protein
MRKEITVDDMVRILESTEAEVRQAEAIEAPWLQNLAGLVYKVGWIEQQVLAGHYQAATIEIQGKPAYVVFYSISDQRWLVVHCFTALGDHPLKNLLEAIDAVDAIARSLKCSALQVDTKVAAMFDILTHRGYKPLGVILLKSLDENPAQ